MGFEFFGKLLSAMLNGMVILYWAALALLLIGIARSKLTRSIKIILSVLLAGVMIGWPVRNEILLHQRQQAGRERLAKAEAIFEERCKTAGEKIYKTAEGVEGFYLVKVRKDDPNFTTNQNAEDPYGSSRDDSGDGFILSFLHGRDAKGNRSRWYNDRPGYRYIETIDPGDGKRYRYTGEMRPLREGADPQMTFRKEPAPGLMPRYAVDFEDLTTPDERLQWIAGGALRVIDLETNEVMAERIGYMVDKGLGAKGGERSPWGYAASEWSCPRPVSSRAFVEKVLKIKEK